MKNIKDKINYLGLDTKNLEIYQMSKVNLGMHVPEMVSPIFIRHIPSDEYVICKNHTSSLKNILDGLKVLEEKINPDKEIKQIEDIWNKRGKIKISRKLFRTLILENAKNLFEDVIVIDVEFDIPDDSFIFYGLSEKFNYEISEGQETPFYNVEINDEGNLELC